MYPIMNVNFFFFLILRFVYYILRETCVCVCAARIRFAQSVPTRPPNGQPVRHRCMRCAGTQNITRLMRISRVCACVCVSVFLCV